MFNQLLLGDILFTSLVMTTIYLLTHTSSAGWVVSAMNRYSYLYSLICLSDINEYRVSVFIGDMKHCRVNKCSKIKDISRKFDFPLNLV